MVNIIYTKMDNGSYSEWTEWDGSTDFQHKQLFGFGQIAIRVSSKSGRPWRIQYRPHRGEIVLPPEFKEKYTDLDELAVAIRSIATWAFKNQFKLIGEHNRMCD